MHLGFELDNYKDWLSCVAAPFNPNNWGKKSLRKRSLSFPGLVRLQVILFCANALEMAAEMRFEMKVMTTRKCADHCC